MAIATAINLTTINYGSSRNSVVNIVLRPLEKLQSEGELDRLGPPSGVEVKLFLAHEGTS